MKSLKQGRIKWVAAPQKRKLKHYVKEILLKHIGLHWTQLKIYIFSICFKRVRNLWLNYTQKWLYKRDMFAVQPLSLSLSLQNDSVPISSFSLSSSACISPLLWTSLSFSALATLHVWRVFVEMQLTHPIFSLAFFFFSLLKLSNASLH